MYAKEGAKVIFTRDSVWPTNNIAHHPLLESVTQKQHIGHKVLQCIKRSQKEWNQIFLWHVWGKQMIIKIKKVKQKINMQKIQINKIKINMRKNFFFQN